MSTTRTVWITGHEVAKLTGMNYRDLERVRRNKIFVCKLDADGHWRYRLDSIPDVYLLKKEKAL